MTRKGKGAESAPGVGGSDGVLKVIVCHPGVASWNGGEYGEWQVWAPREGRLVKEYYSTWNGGVCPRCGRNLRAWESEEDHRCGDYEVLTPEEVRLYHSAISSGLKVLDLTGHEPVPGRLGGCVKCHPSQG